MKSIMVEYDEKTDTIASQDGAKEEAWVDVCRRFNDDVHRVRDVNGMESYTGLYRCFDDDNHPSHFLVEEDDGLYRIRHKQFFTKLGV